MTPLVASDVNALCMVGTCRASTESRIEGTKRDIHARLIQDVLSVAMFSKTEVLQMESLFLFSFTRLRWYSVRTTHSG